MVEQKNISVFFETLKQKKQLIFSFICLSSLLVLGKPANIGALDEIPGHRPEVTMDVIPELGEKAFLDQPNRLNIQIENISEIDALASKLTTSISDIDMVWSKYPDSCRRNSVFDNKLKCDLGNLAGGNLKY